MDLSWGRRKFIVSIVAKPPPDYVYFASKDNQEYIWQGQAAKPFLHDFDVPDGIVFGFFYPSMYEPVLEGPVLHLLNKCFHGRGLRRNKCSHFGSFFIIGTRHSKQCNQTMGQTNPLLHDYSDAAHTNLSLLPLVKSTLNLLSYQVQRLRMSCGESLTAVYAKALSDLPEDKRYNINKTWSIITRDFSNCSHTDNDFVRGYYTDVEHFVKNSTHPRLIEYFDRFRVVFPTLLKKNLFPCPTTCCWVNMNRVPEWTHIQYFLVVEILLAYDLSSDIFQNKETQLAATFYGGLLNHLTSRPIWISKDQNIITSVCPSEGGGLFAWGEYSTT